MKLDHIQNRSIEYYGKSSSFGYPNGNILAVCSWTPCLWTANMQIICNLSDCSCQVFLWVCLVPGFEPEPKTRKEKQTER